MAQTDIVFTVFCCTSPGISSGGVFLTSGMAQTDIVFTVFCCTTPGISSGGVFLTSGMAQTDIVFTVFCCTSPGISSGGVFLTSGMAQTDIVLLSSVALPLALAVGMFSLHLAWHKLTLFYCLLLHYPWH